MANPKISAQLRRIPQVDRLRRHPSIESLQATWSEQELLDSLREVLDRLRRRVLAGELTESSELEPEAVGLELKRALELKAIPYYQTVHNATGVVLHTGLGRSTLAEEAVEALGRAASPQRVEISLRTGDRGGRDQGCVRLVKELTGCEDATVVNNNAAATVVILGALARGRKVLVSRGELVEIGGSYRIPDIMEESGAILKEIGTTNRTHARDYRAALDEDTGMILKVHTSNYKVYGFTKEVDLPELAALAREAEIPFVHDMGSGCLLDLAARGYAGEPTVQESLAAGADLVCFSGDKLLGGPQAGIIAGRRDLVDRCRRFPLFRAVRPGRLVYTSLEATLRLYRQGDEVALARIPSLRALVTPVDELKRKAVQLHGLLDTLEGLSCELAPCTSQAGSGSLPTREYPSWCVRIRCGSSSVRDLARRLRVGEPAVLTRVQDEALILDVRALDEASFSAVVEAFSRCLVESGTA